jgi:hypothetical protein
MPVLFLALSCLFIDMDCPLGPNVEAMAHWVNNGVPFLGQMVGVSFTKGIIKLSFMGHGIAAMQNFPPCTSPNKVRWFVLMRKPVYW